MKKKSMDDEWDEQPQLSLTPPDQEREVSSILPGVSLGMAQHGKAHRTLLQAVTFPLSPTVNSIYDTRIVKAKNGGRPIGIKYTSDAYKTYCKTIRDLLLVKRAWFHSEAPLELCILVNYRDKRAADIDNRVKGLQDALKLGHLFKDDSQVKVLEVREGAVVKGGAVMVTCREITFDPLENLRWIRQR